MTVDRPAFLYLVWLDGTGKATPIYPWIKGDWRIRPETEKPLPRLNLPESAAEGGKVEGTKSGVENLVLLALEEQLPSSVNAEELFAGLKDQGNNYRSPTWRRGWSMASRTVTSPNAAL